MSEGHWLKLVTLAVIGLAQAVRKAVTSKAKNSRGERETVGNIEY